MEIIMVGKAIREVTVKTKEEEKAEEDNGINGITIIIISSNYYLNFIFKSNIYYII